MLWTDLQSIEDFYRLDAANRDIFRAYERVRRSHSAALDSRTLMLFNEVYYIMTRIIYEEPDAKDVDRYVQGIRKDMGWDDSPIVVIVMITALNGLRVDKGINFSQFLFSCGAVLYSNSWIKYTNMMTPLSELKDYYTRLTYDFQPRPCPINAVLAKEIDWQAITNDYDKARIEELCNLWPNHVDRYLFYMTMEAKSHIANQEEISELRRHEGYLFGQNRSLQSRIAELTKENRNLKRRLNYAKHKCSSPLTESDDLKGQQLSLSIESIVQYCKERPTWEDAKEIVTMLLFLNDDKANKQLINSICEHFRLQRNGGNIFNATVGTVVNQAENVNVKS